MKFHSELKYADIKNIEKIIINEDMLKQIEQYFTLNLVENYVTYNFEKLNIEIILENKLNIYIENYEDEHATITIFANELKLVTFVVEYVLDVGFNVEHIFEYGELLKHKESAEELILFALKWFPMIWFYIQKHCGGYDCQIKKFTFFTNTKKSKLNIK